MHDARAVGNFLLDYAESRRIPLTNMALLKQIYFSHGWYLAVTARPLIKNRIEAWEHGPVVRAVYDAFKGHRSQPITTRATVIDWNTGEEKIATSNFGNQEKDHMINTFNYYSNYGAFELSQLTHMVGTPWHEIYHRIDGKIALNMEISNDSIRAYFGSNQGEGRIN